MKKLLIITIVLLIHSFPSYSNTILNKGLVCTNVNDDKDLWAFGFFNPNRVDIWHKDEYDLNKNRIFSELIIIDRLSKKASYETTEEKLIIYYVKDKNDTSNKPFYIDRFNLSMKFFTKKFQCDLFVNKRNFEKKINNFNKRKF